MRANALLNGRKHVTRSDLYLYDLIHPLFLNSMGELGTERLIEAVIKAYPNLTDEEIIERAGVSKGTFYKHKGILKAKGVSFEQPTRIFTRPMRTPTTRMMKHLAISLVPRVNFFKVFRDRSRCSFHLWLSA